MDNLTYEKMMNAIKQLPKSNVDDDLFNPFRFSGIDVHISPDRKIPKIQISEDFKWLTDEARERHNLKLIELFGYKEISIIPENTAYMFNSKMIMNSKMAAILVNCGA